MLREGRAHALTLTSSEGLDNLCALLDAGTRSGSGSFPPSCRIRALREHARELGFDAVETGAADAGLIAGLLEWFAQHPLP